MRVIGLTGSISSGKSLVLKFFRELGIATIDSDEIVSQLYKQKSVVEKIQQKFGTADKKELAKIVFANKQKRKTLEKILHPLVLKKIKETLNKLKKEKVDLVVVDVPLLFEAHFEQLCDKVIVVSVSKEVQLKRLMKRGFSKKEALQRIHAQLPLKEKEEKADFVIDNNGSKQETQEQVELLLKKIEKLASKNCR